MRIKWLMIFVLCIFGNNVVMAGNEYEEEDKLEKNRYKTEMVKTQENEQTALFQDSFKDANENWADYQKKVESGKKGALNSIAGGLQLEMTKEKSAAAISQDIENLKGIEAKDLNNKGTREMQKQDAISSLHMDYSESGNQMHWEYAKELSDGMDELMPELLNKLKEIGADCRIIKGSKEQEPSFYLQMKQTKHKDTKYNQAFCEALRGSYNCTDSVALRCLKRGMRYEPWQEREITYGGYEVWTQHRNWLTAVYWKKPRRGKSKDRGIITVGAASLIKDDIAKKLKCRSDQVEVKSAAVGMGGLMHEYPRDRFRVYQQYKVRYRFREGNEICKRWEETWTERCLQQ